MRALFTVAIFVGSFLLFLIQPMAAKMVLPTFGGAPAVWGVSLVFFQLLLLLGYAYANYLPRWIGGRAMVAVHAVLLVAAAGVAWGWDVTRFRPELGASGPPALGVLTILATTVGLPYLLVSTGAPLIQRWFSFTNDPHARDPFFLYAASNAGSLAGLLAYPFLIERQLALAGQLRLWAIVFVGLLGLVLACARIERTLGPATHEADTTPTWSERLRWIALAAVPSSLLLGVSSFLTTNLAAIPLLWVIPLGLYLLTFVAAFRRGAPLPYEKLYRFGALLLVPLALVLALESTEPFMPLALIHLSVFVVAGLACHGELAAKRPSARHLTEFYLFLSIGGVLGGSFNALLAPVAFNVAWEYPIALVAFLLLRPGDRDRKDALLGIAVSAVTIALALFATRSGWEPGPLRTGVVYGLPLILAFLLIERPLRYGLAFAGFFVVIGMFGVSAGGKVIALERSFFGIHRVIESPDGKFRSLVHGVTTHGRQSLADPATPLTYYHPTGPIGLALNARLGQRDRLKVALVGLGVGSLAAYGSAQDQYDCYEIDPSVIDIARDPKLFTFLSSSKATLRFIEGDARISMRSEAELYDLIVLDAFSSDAIPVHLLTTEAIELYLDRLAPGGVLAFHISNRYLKLSKVLVGATQALGLAGRYSDDNPIADEDREAGKEPSQWFFMARYEEDLRSSLPKTAMFEPLSTLDAIPAWTDNRSNLLDVWGATE